MISLNKTPISVRLIHFDPWRELLTEGWLNSRPQLKADDKLNFEDILKIDTPVSELAGFVAEFTVPILFREIICSARDHVVWARTSRVDNLVEQWNILDSVDGENIGKIQQLADKLLAESTTDSQDEFRKNLPLSYMTSFTTRLSLRTSLKLIKYFVYLVRFPAISAAAHVMCSKIYYILEAQGIDVEKVCDVIKMDDYCPMVVNKESRYQDQNDHIIIQGEYSVMLRAQIIRHRLLHVVDDLSKYFDRSDVWSIPVSDKMHMSIGATKSTWKTIIGKRTCWLAHSSIWADIINDFSRTNANIIDELIPCKDGVCPYNEDCKQRIVRNDPGVPCPRHINLQDKEVLDLVNTNWDFTNLSEKMADYVMKSGRPQSYWGNEIRGAKHFLKTEKKFNEI